MLNHVGTLEKWSVQRAKFWEGSVQQAHPPQQVILVVDSLAVPSGKVPLLP